MNLLSKTYLQLTIRLLHRLLRFLITWVFRLIEKLLMLIHTR
nr:MAG TPA: hypothetical protein [Bacteriophage sp.]